MAKNRNNKKRSGAISMDIAENTELPQAMDVSESAVHKPASGALNMIGESEQKRKHPAWQYVVLDDEKDTNSCKCTFCGKITKGGICRATHHLVGGNRNVKACLKCPTNVKDELKEYQTRTKSKKDGMYALQNYDDYNLNTIEKEDDLKVDGSSSSICGKRSSISDPRSSWSGSQSQPKLPRPNGAMDKFVYQNPTKIVDNRNRLKKLKQSTVTEKYNKEGRDATIQFIMRWIYQADIPLNTIRLRSFEIMLEAVGQFGPGLKPPSYHEARVTCLKKEVQYTKSLMSSHEVQWKKNGCSLMFDGWTDRRDKTLINFLVHSAAGTLFMESMDASACVKTGEKIFQLLDGMVEKIGEENVIQVVTDNASNYVLAGKCLEAKRPHLYWTPCVAHCLDLMLEDIRKIDQIKRCLKKAIALCDFIYNNLYVLNMMREFTNQHELVRSVATRFATSFLTLSSIHKNRASLKKMFISEKWTTCKWAKDPKGKRVADTILMPSFWNSVVYTLKASGPLVSVLKLVGGDKPAMGYIYEAMDRAKEAIKKGFNDNEMKYMPIWEIIDKRWDCQLHRPLHAAGYYLNPSIFYDHKDRIVEDVEVMGDLLKVVQRLIPSISDQNRCTIELEVYSEAKGMFGNDLAINTRKIKTPASWWALYGCSTPILQKLAMRVLNLTCIASGCEHNWSIIEHIHSKKRNKLEQKRLNDLVYVKYNQTLKDRFELNDQLDPITLDHIDDSNEWLVGTLEEDNIEVEGDNELVFDDEDLTWGDVARASGVRELITYTRSKVKGKSATTATTSRAQIQTPTIQVVSDEDDDNEEELNLEETNVQGDVARASGVGELITYTRSKGKGKLATTAPTSRAQIKTPTIQVVSDEDDDDEEELDLEETKGQGEELDETLDLDWEDDDEFDI